MTLRIALLSTTAAFFAATPALAGDLDQANAQVIDQVQLGEVWSDLDVQVDTDASEVWATSVATGNAASSLAKMGDVHLLATQVNEADTRADLTVSGSANVDGSVMTTATAYANSASAGSWSGSTQVFNEQTANGTTEASTSLRLGQTGPVSSATTAAANVSVQSGEYGYNRGYQRQDAGGSVLATTSAGIEATSGTAAFATAATGNAQSTEGYATYMVVGAYQSTAEGALIRGRTEVEIGSAQSVIAATTAAGNSVTASNKFGPASIGREVSDLFQINLSAVEAQTAVTLDNWSGDATASAYGVGNSVLLSNVGADTAMYAIQSNYGATSAQASLSGNTNDGSANVNASAIGNAASATLCNACGDASIGGRVSQFNAGANTATATYNAAGGAVHGSASAIGNTASFVTAGSN